jgi:hypothetical protein
MRCGNVQNVINTTIQAEFYLFLPQIISLDIYTTFQSKIIEILLDSSLMCGKTIRGQVNLKRRYVQSNKHHRFDEFNMQYVPLRVSCSLQYFTKQVIDR